MINGKKFEFISTIDGNFIFMVHRYEWLNVSNFGMIFSFHSILTYRGIMWCNAFVWNGNSWVFFFYFSKLFSSISLCSLSSIDFYFLVRIRKVQYCWLFQLFKLSGQLQWLLYRVILANEWLMHSMTFVM